MNRAFIREPDPPQHIRCPSCGVIGQPVGIQTLTAQLPQEALRGIASSACFCRNRKCAVGYFDAYEQSIPIDTLERPMFPKDVDAPICSCFEIHAGDIIADARAGDLKRVRRLLAHCDSAEQKCQLHAPDGQPCIAEVQRLYLKHAGKATKNPSRFSQ